MASNSFVVALATFENFPLGFGTSPEETRQTRNRVKYRTAWPRKKKSSCCLDKTCCTRSTTKCLKTLLAWTRFERERERESVCVCVCVCVSVQVPPCFPLPHPAHFITLSLRMQLRKRITAELEFLQDIEDGPDVAETPVEQLRVSKLSSTNLHHLAALLDQVMILKTHVSAVLLKVAETALFCHHSFSSSLSGQPCSSCLSCCEPRPSSPLHL